MKGTYVNNRSKYLIVGGGPWGLSTALHLARAGAADVVVLERNNAVGLETASQAAGLVGQIRSSPVMCRAVRYTLDLLAEFRAEGLPTGFRAAGSLMIAQSAHRMESFQGQVRAARRMGVPARLLTAKEVHRLAPGLTPSLVCGGYFVQGDGYLDPVRYTQALAQAARDAGVRIEFGQSARELAVHRDRVVGVETARGFIRADQVTVTAGPWTRLLTRTNLPLVPLRHQSARTAGAGVSPDHPVVRFPDAGGYLRPWDGGYLYGAFEAEPAAVPLRAESRTGDLPPAVEEVARARTLLTPLCPALEDLQTVEYRQGVTPFTPDGGYLIGRVEGMANLWLATACSAIGIAGAASVGKWLAHWLIEGAPPPEALAFSPDRFGDRPDAEWVRARSRHSYGHYYSLSAD